MGLLFDEEALRLLHRTFCRSIPVSVLSRRPGHYGLCILCHCSILNIIYTRYTEVFCQWSLCSSQYLTYLLLTLHVGYPRESMYLPFRTTVFEELNKTPERWPWNLVLYEVSGTTNPLVKCYRTSSLRFQTFQVYWWNDNDDFQELFTLGFNRRVQTPPTLLLFVTFIFPSVMITFLWAAARLIGEWHLCVAFDDDPLPASF
jgi:hypothetical protein